MVINLPPDPKRYIDHTGSIVFISPLSWAEVKERVESGDLNFGRSQEGLKEYKSFKTEVCQEWFSIDSYCRHRYFNLPYTLREADGFKKKYVDESNDSNEGDEKDNAVVFCKNDYPYYFEPDVIHWVLWSIREPPSDRIEALITHRFPRDCYDTLVMENPNKTVKSVYHLHIFARKKSTRQRD